MRNLPLGYWRLSWGPAPVTGYPVARRSVASGFLLAFSLPFFVVPDILLCLWLLSVHALLVSALFLFCVAVVFLRVVHILSAVVCLSILEFAPWLALRSVLFQRKVLATPLFLPVCIGTLVCVLIEGFVKAHNFVVFVGLSIVLTVIVTDILVKTGS